MRVFFSKNYKFREKADDALIGSTRIFKTVSPNVGSSNQKNDNFFTANKKDSWFSFHRQIESRDTFLRLISI